MITGTRLQVLAILFFTGLQFNEKPDRGPLFFTMGDEWRQAVKDIEIFAFEGVDTLVRHHVSLLSNKNGNPLLFFSDLKTPVCADGECKLANIKVYWNLLGNYVGYGIYPAYPLTKYDHDVFDGSDYARLHQLFMDNNSILKRRKISELVDRVPSKTYKQGLGKVDGMSGATKKEIKESVVDGGLYSCYTLWHIIHGEVKEKMKAYLKSIYSDSLNRYFLYSNYEDYRAYALKQLDKSAFVNHLDQIILIFRQSSPLLRTYFLKKIPEPVFQDQIVTQQIYRTFSTLDVNTKTQLIKKVGSAHPTAVEILSEHLPIMTKNQLKFYLSFLNENPRYLNPAVESNLSETGGSKKYAHAYLIRQFLKTFWQHRQR